MIKLSEAKGFRKVAFDVFKDHYDQLWRLDSINGEDTLVRSSDPKYAYASGKNGWSASSDYDFRNITLCYKDIPIHRFSSQEFEFEEGDSAWVIKFDSEETGSWTKSGADYDKDGNIGVSIGKKSFHDDQLLKNFHAILDALEKEKSNNTLKGDLIKNTFVTSSMGVSYKVKLGKSI